jgi:asparagine synthase (glutamine-hydrolysing)
MKGFMTKRIIKNTAEKYLPEAVRNRKKSGFGVPMARWFREPAGMGELLEEIAAETKSGDLIERKQFNKMLTEHRAGNKDLAEVLWTCINFWIWKKVFSISTA